MIEVTGIFLQTVAFGSRGQTDEMNPVLCRYVDGGSASEFHEV